MTDAEPPPAAGQTAGERPSRFVGGGAGPGERNAEWLIVARLLLSISVIAAILIAEGMKGPAQPATRTAYVVFVVACALNLLYLVFLRLLPVLKWEAARAPFTLFQIAVDAILVTSLVLPTGGIRSPYLIFYVAPVMAGAMISGGRAALFFAAEATTLLSLVSLFLSLVPDDWFGPWIAKPPSAEPFRSLLAAHLTPTVGFFLVAVLSGSLAQRLSQARVLSHEILESIGQGLMVVDKEGRLLYVNTEARKLLGREDLAIGTFAAEALSEERLAPVRERLGEPGPFETTFELKTGEGERLPLRLAVRPVLARRRRSAERIFVLTDLTLRLRMEAALRAAERSEAISEMSLSIAHEIRNPLAALRGATQEIRHKLPPGEFAAELLEIVLSESDRLDRIIGEFLNFARTRPLHKVRCDLEEVLEETVLLLQQSPGGAEAQIELETRGDTVCRADAEQLRQVFLNLGLNALAALGEGGELRVRVWPCEQREFARTAGERGSSSSPRIGREGLAVTFADNGCGMDEETRRRAFDPFFTTRPDGSGLGLPVVARIMRAHEGEVSIESKPGEGTRVSLWLPRE